MPSCINCDKNVFFLKINKYGFCKTCNEHIVTKILNAKKILLRSIKVIENSKNDEVIIKNCEIIIEALKGIINYEESGIVIFEPLPSRLIKEYSDLHDRTIAKPVNQNLNKILANYENELKPFAGISTINDLLSIVGSAKNLLVEHGLSRIIAISNHKGGVGKTTSTINIGGGFAQLNKKVLLIDFDPQANLTDGLGKERKETDLCVYHMLKGDISFEDLEIKINDYLSLLPSSLILASIEREYAGTTVNVNMLKDCLAQARNFDFILIDCPPSLNILTMNALVAAKEVIIPLQPEYYSFKGIYKLLDAIEFAKKNLNTSINILGIIGTKFDKRTSLHKEVLEKIRDTLGDKIFDSTIRENIALAEASSFGKTIFEYQPNCHGAEDYMNLCMEILSKKT
jgi:chromosome partitioning protein